MATLLTTFEVLWCGSTRGSRTAKSKQVHWLGKNPAGWYNWPQGLVNIPWRDSHKTPNSNHRTWSRDWIQPTGASCTALHEGIGWGEESSLELHSPAPLFTPVGTFPTTHPLLRVRRCPNWKQYFCFFSRPLHSSVSLTPLSFPVELHKPTLVVATVPTLGSAVFSVPIYFW